MDSALYSLVMDALKALIVALIPYLVAQAIGAIRDERIRRYAAVVVMAAQQTLPTNDARYDYAAAELARRFPSMRQADVRAMIEAAVLSLKAAPLPVDKPAPATPAEVVQQPGDDGQDESARP